MMELRQLRYFIAIVEHGSFSRAASELGRTQQALSKAIHGLEEKLGVRLLDRNSQVASPTAFGKLLLEHGRAIEGETRSFRAKLGHMLEAEAGAVRLGTGPSAADKQLLFRSYNVSSVAPTSVGQSGNADVRL